MNVRSSSHATGKIGRRGALRFFIGATATVALSGCDLVRQGVSGLPTISGLKDAPAINGGTFERGAIAEGRIAFVRDAVLMEWTNGASRAVASGAAYLDPAWSPSGNRLAVVMAGTNHSDIAILGSTGTMQRQLTHDRSDVAIQQSIWARKPVWSPDGANVAFITDREKHDMSLWQVSADGTRIEPLVLMKPYSGGVDWPTWAPNGSEIAYVSFAGSATQVRAFNLRQKSERDLTTEPNGAYDPAWSPDGSFLAYVVRGGSQSHIAILRFKDGTRYQLNLEGTLRSPTWSPHGDSLAYIRQQGDRFEVQVAALTIGADVKASGPVSLPGTDGVDAAAGLSWTI